MRLAPLLLAKLRQLEVEVHTYRETLEEIADCPGAVRAASLARQALGPDESEPEPRPAWASIDGT